MKLQVIYSKKVDGEWSSRTTDISISDEDSDTLLNHVHPDGFWDFIWGVVAEPLSKVEPDLNVIELDDVFFGDSVSNENNSRL